MREFNLGKHGPENPDADIPCGAKDWTSVLPEPIHWGGCSGCYLLIRSALRHRAKIQKRVNFKPTQSVFDWAPLPKRPLG